MANIDYSKSAVNLTNHPEVGVLLKRLHEIQAIEIDLTARIDAAIPVELSTQLSLTRDALALLNGDIRKAVDSFGSYQDATFGDYAVKQRKVSVSYDPQVFRAQYPDYAPAVIKETVDTAKLTGLIKGGLLTPEDLEKKGVSTKSESYAYIIKTG